MKKYMMIAAVAALVSAAPILTAHAEDAAPAAEAAPAVEAKEVVLADGTKAVIKGEEVFVVDAEGKETPAPDGEHALQDGTTIKTAAGKLVVEAPAEGAAH